MTLALRRFFLTLSALAALALAPCAARAALENDVRLALIYESEASNDFAFIHSMRKGAARARAEVGVTFEELRLPEEEDRVEFMRGVAESGVTHVIAVGFQNVVPVLTLAERYPEVKFTVIDGLVPPLFGNVQSIVFKDHEGAFLVGMIAGLLSPTQKIGFIGGMDVPLIHNFAQGYYQGVREARADMEPLQDAVGKTPDAWNNPARAKTLARRQYNAGAGVIFAAAGGSSLGVLEAAKEMGRLAIGVDTNQNGLYPGTVLTSMVKRVDNAVYDALTNAYSGRWEPGIKYLGIKEDALDYAVDVNNKDLIAKEVIERVEDAKDRIVRGQLAVEAYSPY